MRQSKLCRVVVFSNQHLHKPSSRLQKNIGFGVRNAINTTTTTAMELMNGPARARHDLLRWAPREKRRDRESVKEVWRAGSSPSKVFFLPYLFSFCLIMISIDLVRKLGMAPVAS